MDISLAQGLPFALLQPGMPLRLEIKGAIYFGPVNQRTYDMTLPQLEFGMKIFFTFAGYWVKDEHGRPRRLALLDRGHELTFDKPPINVSIDLRQMGPVEVHKLYQISEGFRLGLEQHAPP